jgi:hypothetical protein
MRFSWFKRPFVRRRRYFCSEPWIGLFSVETNLDVTFCPCYLKLKLGSLADHSMQDLWNSKVLIELRQEFSKGHLPVVCQGQLCPVALGSNTYLTRVPRRTWRQRWLRKAPRTGARFA